MMDCVPAHDTTSPRSLGDDPAIIFSVTDGTRIFTDKEAAALRNAFPRTFVPHDDGAPEAAYPIFMRTLALRFGA